MIQNGKKIHVTNIVAKAFRTLGMLSWVFKSSDTLTQQLVYRVWYISVPYFEVLTPNVWDPYLSKDVKQLEKVQHRELQLFLRSRVVCVFLKYDKALTLHH